MATGKTCCVLCETNMTVTLRNLNALICVMWLFTRPLSLFLTHLSALSSIFDAADPVFPHLLPNSKPCVVIFFFPYALHLNLDYSWSQFKERPVWASLKTVAFVHKQEVASCFVPSNWVAVCVQFYISSFVSAGCKRAKAALVMRHVLIRLRSDCAMTSLAITNQALNDLSTTEKEINAPGNWWGRDTKQNKWKRGCSQYKLVIKWWLTAAEDSRLAQDPATFLLVKQAIVK